MVVVKKTSLIDAVIYHLFWYDVPNAVQGKPSLWKGCKNRAEHLGLQTNTSQVSTLTVFQE